MAAEYTAIELGGESYKLRYDLNAVCAIEEELDTPISQIGELEASAKTVRGLLWAGLQSYHPELSKHDVGRLIGVTDMGEVGEMISKAMGGEEGPPMATLVTGTGPVPNVSPTGSSD